jgi:hypothetical protein
MPIIDFPTSPTLNEEYSFEGRIWIWNGSGWQIKALVAPVGATGPIGATGPVALSRVVAASGTSGTLTPNADTTDIYIAEGLTNAITFAAPSGTPTNGQKLLIRIKDNGSARGITWTTSSTGFRAIGIILPTTTVLSKTTYVGCIYNGADLFWDAIATVTQA